MKRILLPWWLREFPRVFQAAKSVSRADVSLDKPALGSQERNPAGKPSLALLSVTEVTSKQKKFCLPFHVD